MVEISETLPAGCPPIADEWDEDPLAGIPREVLDRVGVLEHDTAGGCG
ncbi:MULTISPECIES: hypothetical protein [Streptomyces]|nr:MULTISPECIES: hypothetical protein [Streptomyces]MBC2875750.1 hypothetical protein [Streptomyces sp. TYQ1024]UBI37603.1 hypothetical protein K7I03_14755 [Streptomyces mobaraensis]UKW30191.1 hypothetical protein MCU78_14720 [Streptomyces sp. TYQ1024]